MDEVIAEVAGGLGALEELCQRSGRAVTFFLQGFGPRECHGENVGEATVVRLHLTNTFDVAAEAVLAAFAGGTLGKLVLTTA